MPSRLEPDIAHPRNSHQTFHLKREVQHNHQHQQQPSSSNFFSIHFYTHLVICPVSPFAMLPPTFPYCFCATRPPFPPTRNATKSEAMPILALQQDSDEESSDGSEQRLQDAWAPGCFFPLAMQLFWCFFQPKGYGSWQRPPTLVTWRNMGIHHSELSSTHKFGWMRNLAATPWFWCLRKPKLWFTFCRRWFDLFYHQNFLTYLR